MDVLSATPIPSTSVDICKYDGFDLDSGVKIMDGDGVMLVGSEAFVWRPWMTNAKALDGSARTLVQGNDLKGAGGVVNAKGQFEVAEEAWGILKATWPKPDMLIIGTGKQIRPLAPATRSVLQELGMRLEILDTRNAASQFNLLALERGTVEVVAALVPIGFG
ncbi:MAG: hypothetical protein M1828_007161 [Chrysothrix sp. TS-e1954]|nr:MAG: hypothetical protein M1828_007161 [Chrysothrix sp. TS-e1954]